MLLHASLNKVKFRIMHCIEETLINFSIFFIDVSIFRQRGQEDKCRYIAKKKKLTDTVDRYIDR